MSDARRDLATLTARLEERTREVLQLRHRLRQIADCQRTSAKCYLCATCLSAAHDED